MDRVEIYQKVWKTGGNAHVITIRTDIMKILDLKTGDLVKATLTKIQQQQNNKNQTQEGTTTFQRRE